MTELELNDWLDYLFECIGDHWDGDEASEAIIGRFVEFYGDLDRELDQPRLDYRGDGTDDVVTIKWHRNQRHGNCWEIVDVGPKERAE